MAKNDQHFEEEEGRPRDLKAKRRGKGSLQPPLTPMIDVTFQLLLYFLLTTTFRKDEGQIPGTLPNITGKQSAVKPTRIEIVLRPTGEVYEGCQYEVDNRPPVDNPKALRDLLNDLKQVKGVEAAIVIRSYSTVRWKFIVEAFNAAVYNKFKKIGFGSAGG
jgi:biopolymer transport protein ExbD